jgi:DNA-binding NarL/FixJ family response regulator
LSNAEIARRLYLSESTIKQHLRAVYKELGVRNRTQAARTMREHAGGI